MDAPQHQKTEFYTVTELAKSSRVTPRTIQKLIASGALRGVRFGRILRVRAEDWAAFLDEKPATGHEAHS